METWMFVLAGCSVVGFVGFAMTRGPSLPKALAVARESGDIDAIVTAVEAVPKERRASKWDQSINALWQSYARQAAATLVVEAAVRSDDEIIQYWIAQIIQVEPEIASATFSNDFLTEFFKPEVAASCGRCGSCGCG